MVAIALALGLAIASAGTGAGAPAKGVLRVVATRGPITPVCAIEVPCDGPAANVHVVVRHLGKVVARASTDAAGRARIPLVAGRYVVTASYAAGIGDPAQSRTARVIAGRGTTVTFSFDTGIR